MRTVHRMIHAHLTYRTHFAAPRTYRIAPPRLISCLLCLQCVFSGCGEGWDAYEDSYRIEEAESPGEPWTGTQRVLVVRGGNEIETPLAGIATSNFKGMPAVRLSDLIDESAITTEPERFRYDFTATDGYNLLEKRGYDTQLLPSWETMHHGFLYVSDVGDLRVGWDNHPWGSAITAYNLKYMDGGTIELLNP